MRSIKYIAGMLLVCSIMLNVYGLVRIRDLTQAVSELGMHNHIMENDFRVEMATLRDAIDRVREEGSWMSPIDVTLGERSGDSQVATLTWSLKESIIDSDVILFLRSPGETDCASYKAEGVGDGRFKADIQQTVPVKPKVSIVFHKHLQSGVSTTHSPDAPVELGYGFQHGGWSHDCYVTMTNGNVVRRSEPVSVSFKEVVEDVVSPISVRIVRKDANVDSPQFEICVHEASLDDFSPDPLYALRGVALVAYSEGETVHKTKFSAEQTIEIESGGQAKEVPWFDATVQGVPESASEIFLVLEYEGGKTASVFVYNYFKEY